MRLKIAKRSWLFDVVRILIVPQLIAQLGVWLIWVAIGLTPSVLWRVPLITGACLLLVPVLIVGIILTDQLESWVNAPLRDNAKMEEAL